MTSHEVPRPEGNPLLAGIRVLDFSRLLPGPFCTQMLADLGAEVVKVEAPTGDPTRWIPPYIDRGSEGALYQLLNRGKRSLVLDLRMPEGLEVARLLVAGADVLVEGFRPGVAARSSIDYPACAAINPRLVYASLSGYGQEGEWRRRSGHDLNYEAVGGTLTLGRDRDGRIAMPATPIADLAGAQAAAVVILAALLGRQRSGKGCYVDVSLQAAALSLTVMAAARHHAGPALPSGAAAELTGQLPCYRVYATRDGGYMALAALEPIYWQNFCAAVEHPEWIDGQFSGGERREQLHAEIAATFRTRDRSDWMARLEGKEACCEPVLDYGEVLAHPQLATRGAVFDLGGMPQLGPPWLIDGHPRHATEPAPSLGADTDAVLASWGVAEAARQRADKAGATAVEGRLKRFLRRMLAGLR